MSGRAHRSAPPAGEPAGWAAIRPAPDGDGVLIAVKAVPGAARDEIAGPLGDRVKVRTTAPPEGGRANRAIAALVAGALGVHPKSASIAAGPASAEKLVLVRGVTMAHAEQRLGRAKN